MICLMEKTHVKVSRHRIKSLISLSLVMQGNLNVLDVFSLPVFGAIN